MLDYSNWICQRQSINTCISCIKCHENSFQCIFCYHCSFPFLIYLQLQLSIKCWMNVTAQTLGRMQWRSLALNSSRVPQAALGLFSLGKCTGFLLMNWNPNQGAILESLTAFRFPNCIQFISICYTVETFHFYSSSIFLKPCQEFKIFDLCFEISRYISLICSA